MGPVGRRSSRVLGKIPLEGDVVRDLAGLCGVGLVSYGAWLINPPAGFITAGILLIVGALLIALGNRAAS